MGIKYKTLSGKELMVSNDFRCFGMDALWKAFVNEKNPRIAKMLEEAHSIMSGVLYGEITKEDKPDYEEDVERTGRGPGNQPANF